MRRLLGICIGLPLLGACALAPQHPAPGAAGPDAIPAVTSIEAMPTPARLAPVVVATPPPVAAVEEDIWVRFARERHWQPCVVDPGINRWISRYAGSPERFATTLTPLVPLMDYVLTRSEALGLPSETMLIPIVESYYRPDARGPGGALGLWQLMPDTASRFGLTRSRTHDDRVDARSATDAALRLLELNAEAFSSNPKLMFAAYNAGAYRLRKAIAGRAHDSLTTLDGLGLSRTTRDYLDKIKALGCLLGEPGRFGLELPQLPAGSRLIEYRPPFPIDPGAASERIGVPLTSMRAWNARTFAHGASDARYPLLIPRASEPKLTTALVDGSLDRHAPTPQPQTVATTVASKAKLRSHRVLSGDSLWEIAKRYRVRLADLMRWNRLNKRSVLRIGQRLVLQAP